MDEETDYLDPGLSDTTEGWGVMWNVYLPLLGYRHVSGPAGARLVPYLATTLPRISHDRRTYSLTLRDRLSYSNGKRVKASDFKHAVERDFRLDSVGAAFFRNIRGADAFAKNPEGHHIGGIVVDNATRSIVIHLKKPQADFSNVLASEFAAPVPADAPAADTTLHPLPATGPYQITSYQPRSRIVEERNPHFQAWRFHGAVPAGNPDRVTWDIVPNASVALHRVLTGKDDWMSYYQIPSKRLDAVIRKHRSRLTHLHAAQPHVLLHEHAGAAVHQPEGAAGGELRDLAPLARAARRRAGPHEREHSAAGLLLVPVAQPLPARPAQGDPARARVGLLALAEESLRLEPRRRRRPAVHRVPRLGAEAPRLPPQREGGDRRQLLDDDRQRDGRGRRSASPNWVQDYPHPLDWFRLLDGRTITPTHNSNYANFDVGWVNREIERLTRPKKLTPRVDRRWAALDRRVMRLAPWAPFLNQEGSDFFSSRVRLGCYVNNVLYEFDYASICVNK